MNVATQRRLQSIADAAGADRFEVIRENRHLIVDFWFPGDAKPSRLTVSKTCSDVRGLRNHVSDLRRQRAINGSNR
jgi:hypothetical protein